MALGPGGEGTVTGTARSLYTILGLSSDRDKGPVQQLSVRADPANAGNVYIGKADVTVIAKRHYYLAPGDSFTWGPFPGSAVGLMALYAIGPNTGEILHIASVRE